MLLLKHSPMPDARVEHAAEGVACRKSREKDETMLRQELKRPQCGMYVRRIVNLLLLVPAACGQRPTKLLMLTEQAGEVPVQFTSPNCQTPVLSAPPEQPYEVIVYMTDKGGV